MIVTHDARPNKDRFLKNYWELKKSKTPYTVLIGSGGSAKSYSMAQFLVPKMMGVNRKRLSVLRKVQADAKNSIVSQFVDDGFPFWGFKKNVHYYHRKPEGKHEILIPHNESNIIFLGVEDPERLKGINKVDYLWIEEATEFTEEEFNLVDDRVRKQGVRIFLTLNPIAEDHWIKRQFVDNPPLDKNGNSMVTVIHSTYLDNPFLDAKFVDKMMWYKKYDPDHYRVYGLGLWGTIKAKRPFIKNINYNTMLKETKYVPGHDVYFALDFNVEWSISVKQKIWNDIKGGYEQRYIEFFRAEPEELIQTILEKYGRSFMFFTGDASGNNRTQYTSDNSAKTAWRLVEKYLNIYGEQLFNISSFANKFCDFQYVPTGANMGHNNTRMVLNALYAQWGERDLLQFDPDGCREFLNEAKTIEATPDGRLDKNKLNKEDKGHVIDCGRYDCVYFEYDEFKNLGLYDKQLKGAA